MGEAKEEETKGLEKADEGEEVKMKLGNHITFSGSSESNCPFHGSKTHFVPCLFTP